MTTLKIILKKGNKARYSQILEEFPATSGTLSRVLKALEREKLIERLVDTNSRPPVSYYSVTKKGNMWIKEDVRDSYMALMELNPDEARKLLDELMKKIEQKKK